MISFAAFDIVGVQVGELDLGNFRELSVGQRADSLQLGNAGAALMPSFSLMSTAAGGVLHTKVKDLSSYTVISTGMMVPFCSCV